VPFQSLISLSFNYPESADCTNISTIHHKIPQA
jgi:hypothetical protein